jgi:hypothetical protein
MGKTWYDISEATTAASGFPAAIATGPSLLPYLLDDSYKMTNICN